MTRGVRFDSTGSGAAAAGGGLPLLSPGQLLAGGRYRIDCFLGRGGMGEVYRATDLTLAREVAVKAMLPTDDARARDRFLREAQIAAGMDHPHLVRVFDFLQGPSDLLVMELVDGANAGQLLAEAGDGGLGLRTALRIIHNALDGLAALHARGIVHRDVKPGNFLIRRHDSQVKLSDFGLAVRMDQAPAGGGGTPGYVAPEVWRAEPATPASDVFAAGVSLYELLTGVKPRPGKPAEEVRQGLWHLGGFSATALGDFIARCLAEGAADRYPTAAAALEALKRGSSSGAAAPPPPTGRLLANRIAVVMRDGELAASLATALTAGGLLSPVLIAAGPDDPRLTAALGELDAIVLDPESAETWRVEQFIGGVRMGYPSVVFFLALTVARREAVLARFSPDWRERLGHYFSLRLDATLGELPAVVRGVARKILFDQKRATGGVPALQETAPGG
jgi:hypothetical protein